MLTLELTRLSQPLVLTTRRPHSWWFKEPFYAITQQFERFDHVVLPPEHGTVHKLALFHYVVK